MCCGKRLSRKGNVLSEEQATVSSLLANEGQGDIGPGLLRLWSYRNWGLC